MGEGDIEKEIVAAVLPFSVKQNDVILIHPRTIFPHHSSSVSV